MSNDGPPSWEGRREPNRTLSWAIMAIGTVLLLVAAYQVFFTDLSVNSWYIVMIVLGILAYATISFTSSVEFIVQLGDEELLFTKRERTMGVVLKERTVPVVRSRMAKVVERNAGFGIRVVRIEDAHGRRLLIFPEFLGPEEHDRMIGTIIDWGNQPSLVSSASSDGS